MGNVNLAAAKRAKNDEFYTRREDIENELMHYRDHFTGKTVYCNCDDPVTSEFLKLDKSERADSAFAVLLRANLTGEDSEQDLYSELDKL